MVRLGHGQREQDGVKIFNPDGKPIGHIALPERCANVCFGGRHAQPPVHGRQPLALFAVRQHAGRGRRLTSGQQARQQRRSAVEVHTLQRQQPLLGDGATESGKAAGLAAAGEHAMAGDDDGYGIASHGLADGA